MSEADLEQWIEEEKVCILTKPSPLFSSDSLHVCIVQDEYLLYIHHNVMSYMVPALYQIMDF